jgi:hypothetical protein
VNKTRTESQKICHIEAEKKKKPNTEIETGTETDTNTAIQIIFDKVRLG